MASPDRLSTKVSHAPGGNSSFSLSWDLPSNSNSQTRHVPQQQQAPPRLMPISPMNPPVQQTLQSYPQ